MRSIIHAIRGPLAVVSGLAVAGGVLVAVAPAAQAATFTVTNTGDAGVGSLRQAIIDANTSVGADTINFSLPGAAPHTIQLTTAENLSQALPPITEAVTIDGPGGVVGTPPTLEIVEQPAGEPLGSSNSGRSALWVVSAGVVIQDLSFRGFAVGVDIRTGASGTIVQRCQFGMNLAGTATSGPEMGVGVQATDGSTHGIRNNYIANTSTGVLLTGVTTVNSQVRQNTFGMSRDDVTSLPIDVGIDVMSTGTGNQIDENRIIGNLSTAMGLHVTSANALTVTSNLVGVMTPEGGDFPGRTDGVLFSEGGTVTSFLANVIAGGQGVGLRMSSSESPLSGVFQNNVIRDNAGAGVRTSGLGDVRAQLAGSRIFNNGGLGIDTGTPGVNVAPETTGPVISAVDITNPSNASVTLSYDGPVAQAGKTVRIVIATTSSCHPSNYGDAETIRNSISGPTLNGSGDLPSQTQLVGAGLAPGDNVTVFIDGLNVPLTEFSNCFTVPSGPANTPPVAESQGSTTSQDTAIDILLGGTDADDDDLTFAISTQPSSGTLSNITGISCLANDCTADVTYTPDNGFTGSDSFTFTVNDGQDTSPPATVTIDVQAANTAPVARPGEISVVSDGTLSGRVLYATDIDEDVLNFAITQQPLNGVVLGPNDVTCAPNATFGGEWTCQQTWGYLAEPGYSGSDSFEFEACDPSGACDTATVTVTVAAPPGPDLELTLIDTPDPVNAGGVVAYQATLENTGAGSASGVEVTFTGPPSEIDLPLGTTWVGSTVTSDLGGSGSCVQSGPGTAVICTPGTGQLPAGPAVWTITIFLETGPTTPNPFSVTAEATTTSGDINSGNNADTESTTIEPATNDEATEYVPPSTVTETVATAETALVNGAEIPIAQPGDTTAAAASVPPGGPGGVVTVAEFDCAPPFCAAAARTVVPTPGTPPIDDRVVQFIPPFATFYDYLHPVTYTIAYDASVVAGVNTRSVSALYTKEDNPGTAEDESQVLYQAAKCPRRLTASTEFPCLKSAKVLKGKNPLLKGDLVLTLLGTYNDPKIAGFR